MFTIFPVYFFISEVSIIMFHFESLPVFLFLDEVSLLTLPFVGELDLSLIDSIMF